MTSDLHFEASDFPMEWADDTRMNFLFSNFRERTVNPEGYDAKMKFWMDTIQNICLKSQSPVISHETLRCAFERKKKKPLCLDVVLDNMVRQGSIMSYSEFRKVPQEKGWVGWGFDMLVQKPVSWSFSTVLNIISPIKDDDRFVVSTVVKDLAAKVLKKYIALSQTKWTDKAIFYNHLKEECTDFCSDSNFELAVIQLQREKMASVSEHFGEKVIKFRKMQDKKLEPISELDRGVLGLRKAKDKITSDIDTLEEDILGYHDEAKVLLRHNMRNKALLALRRKKRLEIELKKKSLTLDNIENLLSQLMSTESEQMVLGVYQTGMKVMKGITTNELNLDSVDEIMAGVRDSMDDYTEVQNTLAKSVSDDDNLEDYEAELASLLSEEDDEDKPNKPSNVSPIKNTDEDLLRRLEALRAPPQGVPVAHKPVRDKAMRAT